MKRLGSIMALLGFVLLLGLVFVGMTAQAQEPELPRHPHMLVQRPVIEDQVLVGWRSCVDLANNQALPLNSHHEHIHTGQTGVSFYGDGESGHFVVPAAPLAPWADCDDFETWLPLPLGP